MPYTQVQFVGYAVSTRPAPCAPLGGPGAEGRHYYLGEADDSRDLDFRLALLGEALRLAGAACQPQPEVLKIFVAPEFFFRGAHGAYYGEALAAQFRRGLQKILAEHGAGIDMALCGTALFADAPADFTRPEIARAFALGDEYLQIYESCRRFRAKLGRETPALRNMLFSLDEPAQFASRSEAIKSDPLAGLLEEMLLACAAKAPVKVSNACPIMLKDGRCLTVRKQLKSGVDFILNHSHGAGGADNTGCYVQTFVNYSEMAAVPGDMKQEDSDPYGVFHWQGVKVGVEICLDHIHRRLGRQTQDLDLHIIPSCGVEAEGGCLAARPGGYVFNCDGDHDFADAQNSRDAHTQLFQVKAGPEGAALLGRRIAPERVMAVARADVDRYFPAGAGEVHVYSPQDLPV